MKKKLKIIFCCLIIPFFIGAQEKFLLDSIYDYSPNHQLIRKKYMQYDQGRIVKSKDYYPSEENGKWICCEEIFYSFDEENNTTTEEVYENNPSNGSPNYHSFFEYDAKGNEIRTEVYLWDIKKGLWTGYWKSACIYDKFDNITLDEYYFWDYSENEWYGSYKNTLFYDDNNNLNSDIYYSWNTAEKHWECRDSTWYHYSGNHLRTEGGRVLWIDYFNCYYRYEWIYNEKGKITEEIVYTSDDFSGPWNKYSKYITYYDANGNAFVKERYYWDHERWIMSQDITSYTTEIESNGQKTVTGSDGFRYITQYNSDGKQILDESYYLDRSSGKWDGITKSTYEYDAQGRTTLYTKYDWNISSSGWYMSVVEKTSYDAWDNLAGYEYMSWDENGDVYDNGSMEKKVYEYDGKGQLLLSEYYEWNPESGHWFGLYKQVNRYNEDDVRIYYEEFTYENNQWISSEKGELTCDENGFPQKGMYYEWDQETELWEWIGYRIYYYNPFVVSSLPYNLYANARKSIWLEGNILHISPLLNPEQVEIYTLSGKLTGVESKLKIDISNYISGIYIIKIKTGKEVFNYKIRKK